MDCIEENRDRLKEEVMELDKTISELEVSLSELMSVAGKKSFRMDQSKFILKSRMQATPNRRKMQDLIDAANLNGHPELINTSIHSATLSAFVTRYAEENDGAIPDWVDKYANVREIKTVAIKDES